MKFIQLASLTTAAVLAMGLATAQTGPILTYTATTDNVAGAPDSIRIDVLRWSTDAERDQLLKAWTNPTAPAGGGRGGGRGGRGGAAAPDPVAGNDDGNPPADQPAAAAAAGGRGGGRGGGGGAGGGRGGRGGGAAAAPAAPPTPEASLATALGTAQTVGHLWSSEVAGYSVRYAVKLPAQDGGERVVFVTERRLGAWNDLWKPTATPPDYAFSVIEIHLNAKGEGEGKASLTGKLTVDSAAKTFALENYAAAPVILKNVKRK